MAGGEIPLGRGFPHSAGGRPRATGRPAAAGLLGLRRRLFFAPALTVYTNTYTEREREIDLYGRRSRHFRSWDHVRCVMLSCGGMALSCPPPPPPPHHALGPVPDAPSPQCERASVRACTWCRRLMRLSHCVCVYTRAAPIGSRHCFVISI